MASPSIGGSALSIDTNHDKCGGQYHFHRQSQHLSGAGGVYRAGEQWAEWDWRALKTTDFDTLRTAWSASPSAFELWSDDAKATAVGFTSGAMYEPTHGDAFGDYWLDVHVEFHALAPIQA